MNRMDDEYGNIEPSHPVDSISISSSVNLDCSDIGLSCGPDSDWIPSKGNFFAFFCFHFYLVTVSHYNCNLFWSLLDFIFKTFDLSEILGMLTAYINMCGGFRHIVYRYYYGKSDRGVLPGIFEKYSLNTYPFWPQTLSFECKEVRKRKNEQCSPCPFCVRICFYREVGNYVIKKCDLSHEGHIVNGSSISTHAKTESDLTDDEKKQLATFGKMGSTGLNAKNGLVRLFLNRTYDSALVYRFVRKHRVLQFGDSTNCMIKLVELGSIHKSKDGIFEMTSDNGGRMETLHWSNPLSRRFVPGLSDFVLIDGTHKTNIYDLSLIVTTVVDSLGKSVPIGFLLAPSEHSDSITTHMNL